MGNIMNLKSHSPVKSTSQGRPEQCNYGISWPYAFALAALVLFTTWFYMRHVPLGEPPDEWAHLSYVADITSGGPPIPDYTNSTILNSQHQNYLQHPPLYYTILATPGRIFHWDAIKGFWRYRFMSALMVSLGIFFWVLASMQFGLDAIRSIALAVSALAIPMFPYLAGSINNDNLCYLGVAIFFYGVSLIPCFMIRSVYIAATGLLIAFFAKATGSLFLVAFIVAWSLLDISNIIELSKRKHVRIGAALVFTICSFYYIPTLLVYHTPFPAPGTLYENAPPPALPISFIDFSINFVKQMTERLPIIMSGSSSSPLPPKFYSSFYLMLALPLAAWAIYRPFARANRRRHIADAFFIALLVTICVNLRVCWNGYLQTGLYAGMQPRYYSFALPGIFLFSFINGTEVFVKKAALYVFSILAVMFSAIVPPRAAITHYLADKTQRSSHLVVLSDPNGRARGIETIKNSQIAGYVDSLRINGSEATLNGWAIDVDHKAPARALWVSLQGHLLGTAQTSLQRPDVVRALNASSAGDFGFSISISNLPANLSPCDLRVQAEQDNGTLVPLGNAACHQ
jgi:hypothetical protein